MSKVSQLLSAFQVSALRNMMMEQQGEKRKPQATHMEQHFDDSLLENATTAQPVSNMDC